MEFIYTDKKGENTKQTNLVLEIKGKILKWLEKSVDII